MQLAARPPLLRRSIRTGLAAAAATLIGTGAAQSEPVESEGALLLYSEVDRVSAGEAVISLRKEVVEDQRVGVKLVFDALTGASANGATPARFPQVFTRPSGKGSYTVAAGDTPLDDTFHDTRVAVSGSYDRPLGRMTRMNVGGSGSVEFDYLSVGANAGVTHDLDRRNTTLAAGFAVSRDRIKPVGGLPIPLAAMPAPGAPRPVSGPSDWKTVIDGMLGATQVLGRATLGRVNFSVNRATGYLTDPYKLLTIVEAPSSSEAGDPRAYIFESRPDTRAKYSIYGQIRHHLVEDVIDLSYRYLWDTWGVRSHTAEVRYRWQMSPHHALQPHLRYYRQAAADFYRRFLVDGDPWPGHASADYRLGNMDALTAGASVSWMLAHESVFKMTFEYYAQLTARGPPDAFGSLADLELDPDVGALMVRVGYSRDW